MVNFDYDCSGWATKANTKCYDGLTIAEDAFKGCSGQTVPMVYNHDHSSLDNVIGHALLENRKGGVYAYAKFNDTPTGQTAKKCVENGDLNAFSIWANGLQKAGQVVKHGVIRELSLVLAGCNPGALIQEVVKHSADNLDDEGYEVFIFNDPGSLSLEHGMDPEGNPLEEAVLAHSDDNKEDGKMAEETNGKTLEEVYNSMTDEQKECCHALVGLALEEQDGDGGEDDEEDESDMKHNVFDKDAGKQTVLKHSIDDINSIIKGAKTSGTLKAAFENAGVEQGEIDALSHGIDNIDWLFPEDHLLDTTPRIIDKPDDWVSVVMGGVKHIPFSRFKSMFADLTPEDARAKGYVKGNYKIEEVFGLLRRSTGPTTVYKKQKLDRDDVIDITSFDVVSWLRNEMRYKLNRELALAYILGDGRQAASEDKIDENCIPELALGLSTLAGAFTKFGKGMLYLAGAGAIFGALALFADPLCTAIINAAPDIEAALVAVVTLICGAINQSAEPIGEAFTTLCKVLIQTAIDLIGWAWSGEGGEGEGIKGALEELGKNIWDLQQAKFENTYKTALERYESDDKVAQSEYQLWADTYEKTASVTEKSNKNIETINKRLAIQSEKTALAEKAWVETKDALGEASLVTQQAYRDYLEARQEQLELENELDKAQLAAFDDLSSFYDSRISMVQKRMNLLDKLYNDGDLSGREDAYASAVEQYGKGSIEARRAATQGTMTALMGVNSALTSMRWQLSKVTAMQQKYQTALEQAGGNRYDETVMAAYEDMMETRSTFADYVGNLADAFNVSDATKKAMMQFGDAIAQNWKPIQNGFMAVAKKMNPKLVQGFSDLFGLYMKDGASETVAAATNTVVAAMSGDWASAVASGLTAVLDVVGTDFGQTLTEAISTALKNAFSGNGLFAQLLTKLFGSIDLGGSGSSGGFLSNLWQWLKGGASAAKSFLGGASTAAAGASGATKLIPVLNSVGTATANVASGVTTVAKAAGVAKAAATTAGAATSGVLAKVGMGVAKVASGLGPHGLLAAAVIAGTVTVGTAVVKNWDKVKEAVGNAWSWIKEKASGLWDGMKSIGGNLMSGLATGVKSAAKFGLKVALSPAYAIISGFKHILGIHSPSKVMAGIGEYVIEGLTRGIVSTEGEAEKGMDEVGGAVIRSALATTNAIADHLSTDNHPSITPVVDLSDASRSSAWLNSAFADRKGTISMAATVTGRMARRAETPSRNQNGYETAPAQTQSNRDVVEAVKTLGERIDRVAESVKGMKVVMNGRKFVGEIRSDIDDVVGDIIEKGH